jgi:hypothetical protein
MNEITLYYDVNLRIRFIYDKVTHKDFIGSLRYFAKLNGGDG